MKKEITLAVCITLLIASFTLNSFLLRGYEFIPPATKDEQIATARQIIAESIVSPDKTTKKGN